MLESIKIGDTLYDIRYTGIMEVTVEAIETCSTRDYIHYKFYVSHPESRSFREEYTEKDFEKHLVFTSYNDAMMYAVWPVEDENTVMFNITCTMNKRWVNQFCSFLKQMEKNGRNGHTEVLSFMSDGDGDFRPTFIFGCDFEKEEPRTKITDRITPLYDAG